MDVLSGVRDNWFNVAASTLLVFAATCSGSAEDNKLTGGPTPWSRPCRLGSPKFTTC
jgi:hypothetical protein